jgi:4'-phosphopantetheinyl transferase
VADADLLSGGSPAPVRCEVWLAGLAAYRSAQESLLDEVELDRLRRYPMAADRARFTVAAALVRLVAGRRLGVPPHQVDVDRACPQCDRAHGKPTLRAAGAPHISVSHSAELIALAVTDAAPVGVDVEAVVERDHAGLAATFTAVTETVSGVGDFYTLWTRKEAVVKATGDGLRMPLTQVVVGDPAGPARLVSYGGAPLRGCLQDLRLEPGYAGAVAVLADGPLQVDICRGESALAGFLAR